MNSDDSKKIIIDEDWKSQVEREKHEAESDPGSEPQSPNGLPPASFGLLISTLATQCLASMGQIPDPMNDNQATVNLPLAEHFIDMLAMLETKTSGNLDAEEKKALDEMLHQLRMVFVATSQQGPQ